MKQTLYALMILGVLTGCKLPTQPTDGSTANLAPGDRQQPIIDPTPSPTPDQSTPTPTPSPSPSPTPQPDPLDESQHEYQGRDFFMAGTTQVNLLDVDFTATKRDSTIYFRVTGSNDTTAPQCTVVYEVTSHYDNFYQASVIDAVTPHCDPCLNRVGIVGNSSQFYAVNCTGQHWLRSGEFIEWADLGGGTVKLSTWPHVNDPKLSFVFDK